MAIQSVLKNFFFSPTELALDKSDQNTPLCVHARSRHSLTLGLLPCLLSLKLTKSA